MQFGWKPTVDCIIDLRGLNLDKVWENIIVQIGGLTVEQGNTLDEQIRINEQRDKIQKEINRLEKLARAEKQPTKKFELVQTLSKLRKELSE